MLDYVDLKYAIKPDMVTDNQGLRSHHKYQLKLTGDQFAFSQLNKEYFSQSVLIHPNDLIYIGTRKQIKTTLTETVESLEPISAEYLMISHPLFIDTIKPLAEFYRQKGVKVSVVNINYIYQKYSYGVRELSAIKEMIKDTYNHSNGESKVFFSSRFLHYTQIFLLLSW
jgi:hypothetical protein